MTDGDKKLKEAWEKWEVLRAAYDVTRKANDIAQANFQDARDYYYMIYSVYFNADNMPETYNAQKEKLEADYQETRSELSIGLEFARVDAEIEGLKFTANCLMIAQERYLK